MKDAVSTLQTVLDQIGEAVMRDDFEHYAAHVSLPFNLITETANIYVTTLHDLEEGFDAFVIGLQTMSATAMNRLVEHAHYSPNGDLRGSYVTYIVSANRAVISSFRSEMTLRCVGGVWKARTISNTIHNNRWPIITPLTVDLQRVVAE